MNKRNEILNRTNVALKQLIQYKIVAQGSLHPTPRPLTENDRILINVLDNQLVYSKRDEFSVTIVYSIVKELMQLTNYNQNY